MDRGFCYSHAYDLNCDIEGGDAYDKASK